MAEIGALRPDDVTILDMEASIEHLSRGTLKHVESLLIVTEPYFRAIETLGRTAPLARELGIPHIVAVANKVRSERDEATIRAYCAKLGLPLIGVLPYDEAAQQADRENTALIDYAPDGAAVTAISGIVDALLARAGGKTS